MTIEKWLLSTTALGALGATLMIGNSVPAAAADADTPPLARNARLMALPAVSGFDAKWEAIGGSMSNQTLFGSLGSIAAPLGRQFGIQLDGLVADYGGNLLGGGAGHLFLARSCDGAFRSLRIRCGVGSVRWRDSRQRRNRS